MHCVTLFFDTLCIFLSFDRGYPVCNCTVYSGEMHQLMWATGARKKSVAYLCSPRDLWSSTKCYGVATPPQFQLTLRWLTECKDHLHVIASFTSHFAFRALTPFVGQQAGHQNSSRGDFWLELCNVFGVLVIAATSIISCYRQTRVKFWYWPTLVVVETGR